MLIIQEYVFLTTKTKTLPRCKLFSSEALINSHFLNRFAFEENKHGSPVVGSRCSNSITEAITARPRGGQKVSRGH